MTALPIHNSDLYLRIVRNEEGKAYTFEEYMQEVRMVKKYLNELPKNTFHAISNIPGSYKEIAVRIIVENKYITLSNDAQKFIILSEI